jgi:ABC-type Zn2+ transport system substrate-binding protein/surface adhesin
MGIFSSILDKLGIDSEEPEAGSENVMQYRPKTKTPIKPAPVDEDEDDEDDDYDDEDEDDEDDDYDEEEEEDDDEEYDEDEVDVVAILEELAEEHDEDLNWETSIVDLLKLLGIDSSLTARKKLAKELGCPAQKMNDSAQMNIWLHKTVLHKIAQNGGNIPKRLFK